MKSKEEFDHMQITLKAQSGQIHQLKIANVALQKTIQNLEARNEAAAKEKSKKK